MLRTIFVLAGIIFFIGVLYRPATSLPATAAACSAQQFDTDPWIVSFKKNSDYCTKTIDVAPIQGNRSGNFKELHADAFKTLDPSYWERMDTTFFCNQAVFSPNNVVLLGQGGVKLDINREVAQDRALATTLRSPGNNNQRQPRLVLNFPQL